jgi:hypothetical protein
MKPNITGIKDFSNGKVEKKEPQSLTYEDKYYLLCGEVQKLKRRIGTIGDDLSYWKEEALEAQAERDCLREELQEQQRGNV